MKRISSEVLKALPVMVEHKGKKIRGSIDHIDQHVLNHKLKFLFIKGKSINHGMGGYFRLEHIIFI